MFGSSDTTAYTSDQRERVPYVELALHRLTNAMLEVLRSHDLIHIREDGRIQINAKEVMDRIVDDQALSIADLNPPLPPGVVKHFGGRLSDLTAASNDLRALAAAVKQQADSALAKADTPPFTLPSIKETLKQLAHSLDTHPKSSQAFAAQKPANIQSLRVGSPSEHDQGRLLICSEAADCDLLEQFLHGVERVARTVLDEHATTDYRHQVASLAADSSSATNRFLDFLEDSLARVRLRFARCLMVRLAAEQPPNPFLDYVQRIEWLITAVESGRLDGRLDLSAILGEASGRIDLWEEFTGIDFYACLPLWPEWETQMNETRTEQHIQWRLARDIAWRFRVNGQNPEDKQPAFNSRIRRLADDRLRLSAWGQPGFDIVAARLSRRSVAQWIFLYCIAHPEAGGTQEEYLVFVQRLWQRLESLPVGADGLSTLQREWLQWRELLLNSGAQHIRQATAIFVNRLRTRSALLPGSLKQKYTISCSTAVLDEFQIETRQDPIKSFDPAEERKRWFDAVQVTVGEQPQSRSLLSFAVTVSGRQWGLAKAGEKHEVQMQRALEHPVLPVLLRPYLRPTGEQGKDPTKALAVRPAIEIYYSQYALNQAKSEQRSLAALSLALLAYLVIDVLRRTAFTGQQVATAHESASIRLLRLHLPEAYTKPGASEALYASVAAMELALAHTGSVRTQGLTFAPPGSPDDTFRHRIQGTLAACTAGLPLRFDWPGTLDRLAIVTVAARPCAEHDLDNTLDSADWLLVSRAYVVDRQTTDQARMTLLGMRSRITAREPSKSAADLIGEWGAYLTKHGLAKDLLVIHHHFGARRIGAAARRRAFWSAPEVHARLRKQLPDDACVYILQRDVLPVTRLMRRLSTLSAYEITELNHQPDWPRGARDLRPIYTFATLHVVGRDEAARPQSGLCTYFQITDDGFDQAYHERIRARLMGTDESGVRSSLTAGLRMVHFFESEAQIRNELWQPTLDPYSWVKPLGYDEAGEVLYSVQGGKRYLSLAATLTQAVECLRGAHDGDTSTG